jgi:hypothetical protein
MDLNYYGITGLLVLILDVWAIVSVINSGRDVGTKVLWTVLILVLPVIGFIAWLLMGPRGPR